MDGARNLELKGEEGKARCGRAPLPPLLSSLGKTGNSQIKLEVWGLPPSRYASVREEPLPVMSCDGARKEKGPLKMVKEGHD